MAQVIDVVSLHPETVSNYQDHVRVKIRSRGNRGTRMATMRVNPQVWETAKRLCGGDLKRLDIRSETCVIVRN